MTIESAFQEKICCLPQTLRSAQQAIQFPEVQEMLRKLSEHGLGIFMPHMHDDQTGEFRELPDDVMQVESGLEVSFRPSDEIACDSRSFLPVGWVWRSGASTPAAACEMAPDETSEGEARSGKHIMPKRSSLSPADRPASSRART